MGIPHPTGPVPRPRSIHETGLSTATITVGHAPCVTVDMDRPSRPATDPIPVYFNDAYCAPAIDFETFKKAAHIARRIAEDPRVSTILEIRDPAIWGDLDEAEIEIERHLDPAYLEALRTGRPEGLAASNGLGWDPALYAQVLNSTAGILRAIDDVSVHGETVAASLSSGLHHASPFRGSGYCSVNSLVLGALYAARVGMDVVILDLDAHCGGGTESFLRTYPTEAASITHVDLSLIPFDAYTPRESGTWFRLTDRDSYLDDVDQALIETLEAKPDLVIYNAGVDVWPTLDKEIVRERDRRVATALVDSPARCVIVPAGGYGAVEDIVPLHVSTLEAFAKVGPMGSSELDESITSFIDALRQEEEDKISSTDRTHSRSCTTCGGRVVPIIYGMPSPEAWDGARRGRLIVGGCVVFPGQPGAQCVDCGRGVDRGHV